MRCEEMPVRLVRGVLSKYEPDGKLAKMIKDRDHRIYRERNGLTRKAIMLARRERLYTFLCQLTYEVSVQDLCAIESLNYKHSACNDDVLALLEAGRVTFRLVIVKDNKGVKRRMFRAVKS